MEGLCIWWFLVFVGQVVKDYGGEFVFEDEQGDDKHGADEADDDGEVWEDKGFVVIILVGWLLV